MNQNQTNIPAAIGAIINGGYFVGIIKVADKEFGVVMAGAAGEVGGRWNGTLESVEGAKSVNDGMRNTEAMVAADSKLAERVRALEIGGHRDWYIPSKDELEMAYRQFKPTTDENWQGHGANSSSVPAGAEYSDDSPAQTPVPALRVDEADALLHSWYWSSTQHEALAHFAWLQYFGGGYQDSNLKSAAGRVRAFRRFEI